MLSALPTPHSAAGPQRLGALGFTMIEMMIVVTIIAIATILGIPSYRAWIQNTQIYNAAESAQNGLQKAKALAVSMNANIEFVLVTTSPPSWRIQLPGNALACPLASGTTLTTLLECSASSGNKNVSATTLPNNATTVTFNSLGVVGVQSNPPNNTDGSAPLRQISFNSAVLTGSHTLNVTIGSFNTITNVWAGNSMKMCDPDPTIPATNPRKC